MVDPMAVGSTSESPKFAPAVGKHSLVSFRLFSQDVFVHFVPFCFSLWFSCYVAIVLVKIVRN